MADKTYTLAEIKEMRDVLATLSSGEKHDTSSATPNAQALYGVFPGNANQLRRFQRSRRSPRHVFSTGRYAIFC